MTDDTEFGTLPRFSRTIAIVSGWSPGNDRETGLLEGGVLRPFSGVLKTRIERGRAPMLDLSYLTLDGVVASGLVRPASDTRSDTITPSDVELSEPTATDTATDEEREPTVREVIYGDSGEGTDEHTLDTGPGQSPSDVDSPSLTRLDPGSERQSGRSDTPRGRPRSRSGEPSGSARGTPRDAPSDRSPEAPDSRRDEPSRTTLDRSGTADTPTRQERDAPSAPEGSGTAGRPSTADSPARTVVDQSGPSFGADNRRAEAGSPSVSDAAARRSETPPPRMVTERGTGEAAQGSPERSAPGARAPRASGQSGMGATAGPGEATGSTGTSPADQSTTDGPRMVVDRSGDGSDNGSGSAAGIDDRDRNGPPAEDGTDLSDRTVDSEETVATIRKASRDPESQLIDRLYRTLREREAIERRRRGGR